MANTLLASKLSVSVCCLCPRHDLCVFTLSSVVRSRSLPFFSLCPIIYPFSMLYLWPLTPENGNVCLAFLASLASHSWCINPVTVSVLRDFKPVYFFIIINCQHSRQNNNYKTKCAGNWTWKHKPCTLLGFLMDFWRVNGSCFLIRPLRVFYKEL